LPRSCVGRIASTCRASIGLGHFFPINWLDQPVVLSRDGVEGLSVDRVGSSATMLATSSN
jgi:hypothetical protein